MFRENCVVVFLPDFFVGRTTLVAEARLGTPELDLSLISPRHARGGFHSIPHTFVYFPDPQAWWVLCWPSEPRVHAAHAAPVPRGGRRPPPPSSSSVRPPPSLVRRRAAEDAAGQHHPHLALRLRLRQGGVRRRRDGDAGVARKQARSILTVFIRLCFNNIGFSEK